MRYKIWTYGITGNILLLIAGNNKGTIPMSVNLRDILKQRIRGVAYTPDQQYHKRGCGYLDFWQQLQGSFHRMGKR